jgi:hypothetical protein
MFHRVKLSHLSGLAATLLLAFAPGALASAPAPISLSTTGNANSPLVAFDHGTLTTYVAWTAKPDDSGIDICVLPASASTCSGGGPALLADPQYTGANVPFLAGLLVLPGGNVVVLGGSGNNGEIAWVSSPGGATFLSGSQGIQNSGLPITAGNTQNYYNLGDVVPLNATDVAIFDGYGNRYVDAPVAGVSPSGPMSDSLVNFAYAPLSTDGAPQIAAEAAPAPAPAGQELLVTVGISENSNTQTNGSCPSINNDGYGVREGTVNGSSAAGGLNAVGPVPYTLLACSAETPILTSGGSAGIGAIDEEGPGVAGTSGGDFQLDFHRFNATATGGTFGSAVKIVDLAGQTGGGVSALDATDDPGTGVYAMWLDSLGWVLDYSADGGTTWGQNVVTPLTNASSANMTGIGNGNAEIAYEANPSGNGTQVFLQAVNYQNLIPPTPVTVSTTQAAGVTQGANISVPAGTIGESDKATFSGAHAAAATGNVTYNLYSAAGCAASSKVFSQTFAVNAGSAPAAAVTSALAPGRYYWTDVYSGDATNLPGTSACGSEVLTIEPGATGPGTATSNGSTVTLTITCSAACTVTVTITFPPGSAQDARASSSKRKPITIASGKFSLKKAGKKKLTLKLTKPGRSLLKKHHGKLKTTLRMSDKTAHGTFKSTRTLKIIKKK